MRNPAIPPQWDKVEVAVRSLGMQAELLDVGKPEDLGLAFDVAVRQRVDGLVVGLDTLTHANRRRIVEFAAKHRLPAIYASSEFVGGLAAYGVNYPELYRHAASFVDKIFKGAKPADLPMEQPTKGGLWRRRRLRRPAVCDSDAHTRGVREHCSVARRAV